jgi:hypothetical protein
VKSRFIQAMDSLQAEAALGDIRLRRIFDIMGEEGHSVLLMFLCLPYLQPIPIPGLSTPFGILMALIAIYLFRGKPPWLPKRFENLPVSASLIIKVSEVAEKVWRKASLFIKERWAFFHDNPFFKFFNMFIFVTNAFLLSLPLPIPFSNTIPAVAILMCAIGHTEKDGLFICLSYLLSIACFCFFAALAFGAGYSVMAFS